MTPDPRPTTRERLLTDGRSGRFDEARAWLPVAGFFVIVLGCLATRAILESITPEFPKLDDWSRHGNAIFPFMPLSVMLIASRDRWDPTRDVPFNPNARPLRGGGVHVALNLVIASLAVVLHPHPQLLIDAFLAAVLIGLASVGGYREAFLTYRRRRRVARYAR